MVKGGVEAIIREVERSKEEIVNFCSDLVKIPSETGEEGEIQDYLFEYLRSTDAPLEVEREQVDTEKLKEHSEYQETGKTYEDRPNIIAQYRPSGSNLPSLSLNGHTDVVTPEPLKKWQYGPWSGEITEEKIYGRGSCDMKAGVTAIIKSFELLDRLNLLPNAHILLELVVDEEDGGNGTLAATLNHPDMDGAIITEPTGGKVLPAHRGGSFWRLTIEGKGAICGRKYKGVSAVDKAIPIYQRIQEFEKERNKEGKAKTDNLYFQDPPLITPINIGKVRGGSYISGVPEECVLEGALEVLPGEDLSAVQSRFEEAVEGVAREDNWLRYHPPEIEWFGLNFEGSQIDKSHPLVKHVVDSIESTVGEKPEISGLEAGCDMRIKVFEGIPTLIFGPGSAELAHAVDEYVEIPQLLDVTKSLASIMFNYPPEGGMQ